MELIESGEPIALTDVILTEVLQGLRSDREADRVERHLRAFPILRLGDLDDFVLAARLHRAARPEWLPTWQFREFVRDGSCEVAKVIGMISGIAVRGSVFAAGVTR